ncbi:fimbrial protein [Klebsiella aerogenes]
MILISESSIQKIIFLVFALCSISLSALAVDNAADVSFHGTLIEPPPCNINEGEQIDVDFGNRIGISKVDGNHYKVKVNYQISCENSSGGNWGMTLSLNGTSVEFDDEALLTSKVDLGIRIYQNDKPFTPNSTLNIDANNPPILEAVPVKKSGSALTEGSFEAWATLRADYQ